MRNLSKAFLLAAIVRLLSAAQPPAAPILSVCELLKDRTQYDGKMVIVRVEEAGSSEGGWLVDRSCSGSLAISGRDWGWEIALVSPDFAAKPVEFQYDKQAEERLQREFKKLKVDVRKVHVFVTYEGIFETRPDSHLTCRGCGFGHLGGSPTQLVVKTERDLVVKRRQTKK
jgi:hypothetical protein